ncbi:hypothetical protein Leryth_014379 [Lithospermum erythrorhizon]|nr:hypothetical protein Leryth_014379 [Lithospermum erythrorhizon]
MASACVNNVGISPESFLDRAPAKVPSYGWLSPRKSCSRGEKQAEKPTIGESNDVEELGDFEFCLEDNFTMLPADELFLNGKLMPLELSMAKREVITEKALSRNGEISIMDPYLFSPKAPRCTTRWKELLGLRKLYQKEKEKENNNNKSCSKSIKNLLNRSSKSSSLDCSVNLPLLKESDNEHDDLPRLSVDAPRGKRHTQSSSGGVRAMRRNPDANLISLDSPRMNASGKIVFHNLERSSSSPSSYGAPRYKHSSVQRSYSANVRVTPVLNVPVCSLRGGGGGGVFGLFASSTTQPKRDSFGSSSSKGAIHNQCSKHRNHRNSFN